MLLAAFTDPSKGGEALIRTKQRELILEAVMQSMAHPTADELFHDIRPKLPTISLATVYRNLNLLAEDGRIRKISMPGMPDRFDWRTAPHDHFLCRCCGRVYDFTLSQPLEEQISAASDMQVESYSLVARGLCRDCLRKTN